MDWLFWAAIALAVLLLILLLALLMRQLAKKIREAAGEMQRNWDEEDEGNDDIGSGGDGDSDGGDTGSSSSSSDEDDYQPHYPTAEERRAKLVQQVMESKDADIIDLMRREAGIGQGELTDRSHEAELVQRIAKQLGDVDIAVLRRAANQDEVEFDLRTTIERLPVNYPTQDIEPTMISGLDQLSEVSYDEMMSDDFYERAALGDLTVMQAYESQVNTKLIYILMDVSLSMNENMRDGSLRHIWSRAIGVSLMLSAIKGNAKYFLRFFSGAPSQLQRATTQEEALEVSKIIQRAGLSQSGTNIPLALAAAIKDIRTQAGDISQSEILLISDGEDPTLNTRWLQEALGDDIRLHVILIGAKSDLLKSVASSYKEII